MVVYITPELYNQILCTLTFGKPDNPLWWYWRVGLVMLQSTLAGLDDVVSRPMCQPAWGSSSTHYLPCPAEPERRRLVRVLCRDEARKKFSRG